MDCIIRSKANVKITFINQISANLPFMELTDPDYCGTTILNLPYELVLLNNKKMKFLITAVADSLVSTQ
jgi:hypothetical protein